jgi:hypothetical protein
MTASDPTELLSRLAPVSDGEAAEVFGAGKEHLRDAITQLPHGRSRSARPLPRRPLVIAVAALVVVAATGAGWALTRGSAQETTSVDCIVQGVDSIVDATSGDPATDCASVWAGLVGSPAPPLTAYDNGLGGVAVIPSSEKPPTSWTLLASQNVALIELQESLNDHISGLASACFGSDAATTFVRRQFDRLGFADWRVDVRSSDGACYGGYTEPDTKTVVLGAGGDQSGAATWPPHQLADSLRPLTQECLTLPAMENEVVQRATALGMSQTVENDRNYQLTAVKDDTLSCASVTESVGGTTDVIVRGPAHAGS